MRRLSATFLVLLAATLLSAATISRDEARQLARAFLDGKAAASRATQPSSLSILTDAQSPSPACYAFNIGSDEGFVIVAADDRPDAVIAYGESGTITTMPANARAWLDGLAGRSTQIAQPAHYPQSAHQPHPPHSTSPVRPLLPTQWGQQSPYNQLCPAGCATGCVATAMAQVMNYHQWPQGPTTVIPAYSSYDELPPVSIDWTAMPTMATADNYQSVALLMQYCGHAVQMNYSSASWAYEQNIPTALTHFFGYDGGTRVVYSMDYTADEWQSLILEELQAGRPVIYSGQRSAGSHEFVVDGYDGQGFFHFNWGWGGQSDGWYRLSAANPAQVGTGGGGGIGLDGYSTYQSAVIGIQPDRGGTPPTAARLLTAEEMVLTSAATMERTSVGESFTVKICCPFANHTADTLESGFGLALADADGQLIEGSENLQYAVTFVPGSYIYRGANQTITFGANMTGTYRIVPVCNIYEGKKDTLKTAIGANSRYIEAVLTETTLTLTEHPSRNLTIDDIQFTLMGTTIVATATVSNHGDDYNGLLYLFIRGLRVGYTGVSIPPGETATATFYYNRLWTEQEYVISYTKDESQWITKGKANFTSIDQNSFTVWYADGRQERISLDGGTATIPAAAVAADFGDQAPATIIPNTNPNCLYYITGSSAATEGLSNVISSHYTPLLTLTDGHDFYCPMPFTAGEAVYTRTVSRGYDGKGGGWDTIILPFDVETVTADNQPKDWFHAPDDTGKDFWLMAIATATGETLTFTHADRMEANRPYLMAVPGTTYGERSLQGTTMTFAAHDVVVRETAATADYTEDYCFTGANNPTGSSATVSYQLNMAGTSFMGFLRPTPPFRAALLRYRR
ncbi:MAG: C10 family peptidase [Prevotella sp.]|nr:C10 family peptidase [Prevotella sp.]